MKYTVGPYNSTCHQHAWSISITTNLVYVSPLQEKFRSVQSPGELKVMDCFLFGKALRFILHPVAEEKPILNTIHRRARSLSLTPTNINLSSLSAAHNLVLHFPYVSNNIFER